MPVDHFTPEKWTLDDVGSWKVYFVDRLDPEPAFDSAQAVLDFYVARNPEANTCGTTPYASNTFQYWYIFSVIGQVVGDPTGGIAYTDPEPSPASGTDLEVSVYPHEWIVPVQGSTPPSCDQKVLIWPYRRRIAVCPAGFVPSYTGYDPNQYPAFPGGLSSSVLQLPDVCFKQSTYDPKNLGTCNGPNQTLGNPVSIGTGNKFQQESDIAPGTLGTLSFARSYNSFQMGSRELGQQWRHSYDRAAVADNVASITFWIWMERPDGKAFRFSKPSSGTQWVADADVNDRLYKLLDGSGNGIGWRYVTSNDDTEMYDASGKLQSVTARNGVVETLVYSSAAGAGVPKAGLLTQVSDSLGRQLTFIYDQQARISQVTDTAGQVYQYQYDAGGNLSLVTYPDGKQRSYLYNEAAFTQNTNLPWVLTGIVDENGARYATFSYDATGRAVSTSHAGGVDTYQFSYSSGFPYSTVVTDPVGVQRTFSYSLSNRTLRNTSLSQPCASCGSSAASSISYDANGNSSSVTDFRSATTTRSFDPARNLELSRTEASGTDQQRTIQTQWSSTWRLPTQITEPAPGGTKTTTLTYDGSGNLTQKSVVAPKNDGSGTTITRTWQWTYGTIGRVATRTDPDSHTTTYAYYADANADLGKRGNIQSITNAVGHTSQINSYDGNSRPLSVTDPNGLVTTMTYDPRGRLTSRQVGAEKTSYAYDGVGQMTLVTLPDGSYVRYTYDAAHRLTQVDDGLGNKVVYTLDTMGNRIGESAYDPMGALARTRTRQFDLLNRLAADLGAQSQTTAYTHDNNGNMLTATDPLGHSTGNIYDALNRLSQVLDPALGVAKYAYDPANNTTQVTDPRNLATTYKYDGLNDLVQKVSPDTGTTTNTYDAVGNVLTKTDARGVTATYLYDGINRPTQVSYANGTTTETHQYQYDVGSNANGRLSQISDPSGVTAWTYNSQGRVSSTSQTIDALTRTLAYAYNGAGQLTSMTTPSGQQVGYGYLNNRVTSITVNGQPLLQGAATKPFGPVSAWHWGNGLYTFRDYDLDGRIATWEFRNGVSVLRKDQTFDAASRITAVNDPLRPAVSQAYQYDVLDRLTVAQTASPPTHTQQFAYDLVGNRLSLTVDAAATNFAYAANSNRLQNLSGSLPANYMLGTGSWTFSYNNANRLSGVTSGASPVATYRVNALGQRVSKSVGGIVTYFFYNQQGNLIGEYDATGKLIEETAWLEGMPVATLRPTGTGIPTPVNMYYVHADHQGSPRAITRPVDNAIVWQWDNTDPFGANAANENPSGQGTFTYNLRFPGQYYDAETGTSYNYNRDFDPTTGRYEQSDPIGLAAGLNTYAYAGGNPIQRTDPLGLDWFIGIPGDPGVPPPGWFTPLPVQPPIWPPEKPPYGNGNWDSYFKTQDGVCSVGGPIGRMMNANRCVFKCCQVHDDCYTKNRCNESSWVSNWYGLSSACQECNSVAMGCVLQAAAKSALGCPDC